MSDAVVPVPDSPVPEATQEVPVRPADWVTPPTEGEVITSVATGNSYTMGGKIGEGHFGMVYACFDTWGNDLAAKVMKPLAPYEKVKAATEAELNKLIVLRHPHITYVFDAFEYRDSFYIITERCYCPLTSLFSEVGDTFKGALWIRAVARCLLQAVQYIHNNQYVHQDIHLGNVFAAFTKDEMVVEGRCDALQAGRPWSREVVQRDRRHEYTGAVDASARGVGFIGVRGARPQDGHLPLWVALSAHPARERATLHC
jgi:hypothetical protein